MRLTLRERLVPAFALGTGALVGPAVVYVFVAHHAVHFAAIVHFGAVGVSALAASAAAIVLTVVGARRGDGRTVLVGTAFSVMAALLALHGLATPGILVGANGLVAVTGGATLPVGGAVLALSTLPGLRRPPGVRRLLALQGVLLGAVIALGFVGLLVPGAVPNVPTPGGAVALSLLAVSIACYAVLALRALTTYLLTRRGADFLVVIGIAWLTTALPAALLLNYLELGWWLGQGFELAGIVLVGVPVALDLHRGVQSRPLAGDLRAAELVASEEAFLGARVRALTVRLAEKDRSTEEHTRRVALRAVQVGEELGLPPGRLRSLATGGLLHDIGKLSVPDAILQKPGALDEEELAVVQRHPGWGDRLLADLGFSAAVRRLVHDHHERLDGQGYPRTLRGGDIDLDTCILAVCDVYDALVSPRVYRPAWTHERALAHLQSEGGASFDHRCVRALESVLARERGLEPAEPVRQPALALTPVGP